jgi:predicted amidohydrolase
MKAGFVQTCPVFGDVRGNLARAEAQLEGRSADLLVLPELFNTGYQFNSREEVLSLAESIPGGPTAQFLISLAIAKKTTLVAGLAERDVDDVYNSALIAGPSGYVGKYRKAHLFDTETNVFRPGNLPFPVFDVGGARVGIMICFDWRFPEAARTLALQGADIIAHPSNLVLPHCPQAMITRCLENRVFAITANRVGREERGQPLEFIGQSQAVDPDGQVLYRASIDKEEVKVLEIDISKARNKKINPKNDLFSGRRSDLYRLS